MRVAIGSDTVCPWCYAGKKRLEFAVHALRPPGWPMRQRRGIGLQYVKCSARRTSRQAKTPAILQVFERLQRPARAF